MQKIATKLVKIMDELAEGEKQKSKNYSNSFNETNGEMLGKINKLLVKYNVCSNVKSKLISMKEITTVEESIEYLAMVKAEVMLIDADSGETINFVGLGSSQDSCEKAVIKAQIAGIRSAFMMGFLITKEDVSITYTNKPTASKNKTVYRNGTEKDCLCHDCKEKLTEKVYKYSLNKYGFPLCMKCQKSRRERRVA